MKHSENNSRASLFKIIRLELTKSIFGQLSIGLFAFIVLIGVYAPFFASSKPIFVRYEGCCYFPLFKYLFFKGFYTKAIDVLYNIMMLVMPFSLGICFFIKSFRKKLIWILSCFVFVIGMFILLYYKVPIKDPGYSKLRLDREQVRIKQVEQESELLSNPFIELHNDWYFELQYMSKYEQLNILLSHILSDKQDLRLSKFKDEYVKKYNSEFETQKYIEESREKENIAFWQRKLDLLKDDYNSAIKFFKKLALQVSNSDNVNNCFDVNNEKLVSWLRVEENSKLFFNNKLIIKENNYINNNILLVLQKRDWLIKGKTRVKNIVMPILRDFHWEEQAGGSQKMNSVVSSLERTRINRKDLMAGLIFGIRVSILVGTSALALALSMGVCIGLFSGYFAGITDIIISRLIEIWESMPQLFMLLLIVSITQVKSIFLIIVVLAIFGWTGFSRFVRAEALKQNKLPYVLACKNIGYSDLYIMFSHVLPNSINAILALIPFSIMTMIAGEASIAFLGLGEDGSASLGALMNEGCVVFNTESYLIWPPALFLTILLITLSKIGDVIKNAVNSDISHY